MRLPTFDRYENERHFRKRRRIFDCTRWQSNSARRLAFNRFLMRLRGRP